MTGIEGKALLKECFRECQIDESLDRVIRYKTGNRKHACDYQHDIVDTPVKYGEIKPGMRYVVKCFTHFDVYVAWPVEVGLGNGKYICYRKDLVELEEYGRSTFQEKLIDQNIKAYYFKGKAGIKEFINTVYKQASSLISK